MSVARARFRRSLDTTFVVHVVVTLLSAVVTSSLVAALGDRLGDGPHDAARRGLIAEGLLGFHVRYQVPLLVTCGGVIAIALVLRPLLGMAWARAIADGVPVRDAFARAPSLYLPALLARLVAFASSVPALLLASAIPVTAHYVLDANADVRAHDLGVLVAMLPCVLVGLASLTLGDLAEVALVVEGPRVAEAWLLGLRALRGATLFESIGWRLVRFVLGAVAALLAVAAPRSTPIAALAFFLAQSLLLASTCVRALWLTRAVGRVEARR